MQGALTNQTHPYRLVLSTLPIAWVSLRTPIPRLLLRGEHEEILIRQKRMLARQAKAVVVHLTDQIFTGDFHSERRADGQFFFVKVDHDDLAARLQKFFYLGKILRLI